GEFRIDSSGDLNIGANGNDNFFNNDNLWVCKGGDFTTNGCPAGTPAGLGNILVESNVGIGTSTPRWNLQVASSTWSQFTLSSSATDNHWSFRNAGGNFYLATSSPTSFATSSNPFLAILPGNYSGLLGLGSSSPNYAVTLGKGSILSSTLIPATSTSMTLDAHDANDFTVRLGKSATTITLTGFSPGQRITVDLCNPGTTAGAVTWSGVQWDGATSTQNTTANKCQTWFFRASAATTTSATAGDA